jgi:biopolymer transport protein ExbD
LPSAQALRREAIDIMQLNSSSGSGLQSEINITPLVDVVLVLLIIFMVVVPLLMQGYDVGIPRTSSEALPFQVEDAQIILTVAPAACSILAPPAGEGLPADCRVTLADQEIPAAELPARVAEILGVRPSEKRVLFLAADERLNYEGVLRILDLAKSGVEDLKIEFVATN